MEVNMFSKTIVIKIIVILVLILSLCGCSQAQDEIPVETWEYLVVPHAGNYTPAMSSVPGLPISIETDEDLATDDMLIKIRYSGGRMLRSTASFEWDRELYYLELEYEDRTIYWTPFEEDGVFIERDEIVVMEVFNQEQIVERKVFSIVSDNGFYFLEESDPYEKLFEQSESIRNISEEVKEEENCSDSVARDLLRYKGITDCSIILEDLKLHPELIPYDGVLGGTMQWSGPRILNSKWVYGEFCDGHVVGYAILEYEIKDDLSIEWENIDAFLDGE
jgi:hypothetical protein